MRAGASFTVEISLLMPIIFGVTILVMFMLIKLHNRNVCYCAACRGALESEYCVGDSNSVIGVKVASAAGKMLENGLIAMAKPEVEVEVSAGEVTVGLSGTTYSDYPLAEIFGETGMDKATEATCSVKRLNPGNYIRKVRTVMAAADKIKGEKEND